MPKKDFTKRAGQIYAIGIQNGFLEEDLMRHLNESFLALYNPKRQKEIQAHITEPEYTKHRYERRKLDE